MFFKKNRRNKISRSAQTFSGIGIEFPQEPTEWDLQKKKHHSLPTGGHEMLYIKFYTPQFVLQCVLQCTLTLAYQNQSES